MTSRHLVDSELVPVLERLPSLQLTVDDLPAIREQLVEGMLRSAAPPDQSVSLEQREIAGPDGTRLRLHIYRPGDAHGALPVVLHFHPGGFIMGSPAICDTRNRHVARSAECMIVSVEYRFAPESPFPAALNDGYAALLWVHREGKAAGADPERIVVAGESAGGGVAAAVAQIAHDRGEVSLLMQLLTYPMLDNRIGATVAAADCCGEFVWTQESNQFAWGALLGEDHAEREPPLYAAPGRRGDLAGLPPTFIAVGAIDLFAEEDIDFARRLLRAGVPTELHVLPGAFHGFDSTPGTWATNTYLDLLLAALRRAFATAAARQST